MDSAPQSESTYVFDVDSTQEIERLVNQDRFITRAMGGALAELPPLPLKAQVLDIACGPGGWVLDVAHERPDAKVYGIDVSLTMVDYAKARAHSQGIVNAFFEVMDIRQPLTFASASFDMINIRFLVVALKRTMWPPLLAECKRLLRPGGLLRLTEIDDFGVTSSAACEQITALILQVFQQAGYGFSAGGNTLGMSPALLKLCKEQGLEDLHLRSFIADYSAGTDVWISYCQNAKTATLQAKPMLINSGLLTDEQFEQLYQQLITEMNDKYFAAIWSGTSIWVRTV